MVAVCANFFHFCMLLLLHLTALLISADGRLLFSAVVVVTCSQVGSGAAF